MLNILETVIIKNSNNTMSLTHLWKVTLRKMNFSDGSLMNSKPLLQVGNIVPLKLQLPVHLKKY